MVYFVQRVSGGLIKIGTTTLLSLRVKTLAAECREKVRVLGLMRGNHQEENALHRQFKHLREKGEWFRPADDLMDFILKHAESYDDPRYHLARISIDIPERVRRAILCQAAAKAISVSDLLVDVICQFAEDNLSNLLKSIDDTIMGKSDN